MSSVFVCRPVFCAVNTRYIIIQKQSFSITKHNFKFWFISGFHNRLKRILSNILLALKNL